MSHYTWGFSTGPPNSVDVGAHSSPCQGTLRRLQLRRRRQRFERTVSRSLPGLWKQLFQGFSGGEEKRGWRLEEKSDGFSVGGTEDEVSISDLVMVLPRDKVEGEA